MPKSHYNKYHYLFECVVYNQKSSNKAKITICKFQTKVTNMNKNLEIIPHIYPPALGDGDSSDSSDSSVSLSLGDGDSSVGNSQSHGII